MHTIYLGLGTNLGNRMSNLQRAISSMSQVMTVTAVSPIYESEPWGVTDQPMFLNMCLEATTVLNPKTLLHFLKNLENEMGREETIKWGPRIIDIDILLYDDQVLENSTLTIPHPYMHEREFVMVPLANIAPDVVHPVLNKKIGDFETAVMQTTLHQFTETIAQPMHA